MWYRIANINQDLINRIENLVNYWYKNPHKINKYPAIEWDLDYLLQYNVEEFGALATFVAVYFGYKPCAMFPYDKYKKPDLYNKINSDLYQYYIRKILSDSSNTFVIDEYKDIQVLYLGKKSCVEKLYKISPYIRTIEDSDHAAIGKLLGYPQHLLDLYDKHIVKDNWNWDNYHKDVDKWIEKHINDNI